MPIAWTPISNWKTLKDPDQIKIIKDIFKNQPESIFLGKAKGIDTDGLMWAFAIKYTKPPLGLQFYAPPCDSQDYIIGAPEFISSLLEKILQESEKSEEMRNTFTSISCSTSTNHNEVI